MKITSIKTKKLLPKNSISLFSVLDESLTSLSEKSIVVITSKIVSICEGRVVKIGDIDKKQLINQEADLILSPQSESKYKITLTIKDNIILPTSGIDESNGNGYYILWPENSQNTANKVRDYLCRRFGLKNVGVVITDSRSTLLRWGSTGVAIAHSGFTALKSYVGKPDIFGRLLKVTRSNIMDAIAVSGVLVMGEGAEQTPIAVVEDIPFIDFLDHNPTIEELKKLKLSLEDDFYSPLLRSVNWKKGKME
jgi:putative folate metabolism gamma-glutamate ligase